MPRRGIPHGAPTPLPDGRRGDHQPPECPEDGGAVELQWLAATGLAGPAIRGAGLRPGTKTIGARSPEALAPGVESGVTG